MDCVKIISALCDIVDRQNDIIRDQAMELAQHTTVARESEIQELRKEYSEVLGEVSAP